MKLQIQAQTLRFRIDEAELARLLAGETILNTTDLGRGGAFSQSLGLHAAPVARLEGPPGAWRVLLPESTVRGYVPRLPCRDALGFDLPTAGAGALSLRFEVDVRDSLQHRGGRRRHGAAQENT